MADSETTRDVIAGWIGGAVGIVVSNPLEVLKVRLQTKPVPTPDGSTQSPLTFSRSPSPIHHCNSPPAALALKYSIPPSGLSAFTSADVHNFGCSKPTSPAVNSTLSGLKLLWRQEGYRFMFAGAAAPILGLAFIDSFFFATYGKCMSILDQDRERPNNLSSVFASGAVAGGCCALLQTPIEVIKCRAQAEHLSQNVGGKAGSFAIAKKIYQGDGLRGFYLGGLMTGLRDSLSSGIFFTSYALIRRALRNVPHPEFLDLAPLEAGSATAPAKSAAEILEIMVAGGSSGMISALFPYPLDIIKTRLQVNKVTSSCQTGAPDMKLTTQALLPAASPISTTPPRTSSLSVLQITRQIYAEGKNLSLPNLHHTRLYRIFDNLVPLLYVTESTKSSERPSPHSQLLRQRRQVMRIALRFGGLMGFFRGLKPTLVSSFVGSAITMGIFEFVFDLLGKRRLGSLGAG